MPNKRQKQVLPSTLQRSPQKAQRTWKKTHDRAADQYGDAERAHRTAYAALKQGFEKKGGRWVQKSKRGPSDPRSRQTSTAQKRAGKGETYGGVDAEGNSKQELYRQAKRLGIEGRSKMNKRELARAIAARQ